MGKITGGGSGEKLKGHLLFTKKKRKGWEHLAREGRKKRVRREVCVAWGEGARLLLEIPVGGRGEGGKTRRAVDSGRRSSFGQKLEQKADLLTELKNTLGFKKKKAGKSSEKSSSRGLGT